jgi:tetratricopeptide (TPR) repeat protein
MSKNNYQITKRFRTNLLNLGKEALDSGGIRLARGISDLLLEVAPDWPQWLELRAAISMHCGLTEQAEQELRSCLSRFPNSANALSMLLQRALDSNQYERVLSLVDTYGVREEHAPAIIAASDKIAGAGDAELALSGFMALVKQKFDDVDLYIRASRLAVSSGDLKTNSVVLSTLRELRPNNAFGHLEKVHTLSAQGRMFEARETLEELDNTFPESSVILSTLVEVEISLYEAESALKVIEKLQGKIPGRRLRDMQIRANACQGNWKEVEKLCEGVGVGSTEKDRILAVYSKIYLGDFDSALDFIEEMEESGAGTKRNRWLPVARQVANFGKKNGLLVDDPQYHYVGGEAEMDSGNKVQMLWVGGDLSPFEHLSISSWLHHGFSVDLYTYGEIGQVPDGCVLRDASEILSKDQVFVHSAQTGRSKGSFAGFADVFRWELLRKRGGFWADCDIVCLNSFDMPKGLAIASEIARTFGADHMAVTNCFFGGPAGHPMFEAACKSLHGYNPETLGWGEVGTRLIGEMVDKHNLERFVLRPDTFNPISPYRMIPMMRSTDIEGFEAATANSWGLHLYNEVWRSHKVSKFGPFPRNSVIHRLFARFNVQVDVTPELPSFFQPEVPLGVPSITSVSVPPP